MSKSVKSLEESIVKVVWEDKDIDSVTQYEIDKHHLHLKDVDELSPCRLLCQVLFFETCPVF